MPKIVERNTIQKKGKGKRKGKHKLIHGSPGCQLVGIEAGQTVVGSGRGMEIEVGSCNRSRQFSRPGGGILDSGYLPFLYYLLFYVQ